MVHFLPFAISAQRTPAKSICEPLIDMSLEDGPFFWGQSWHVPACSYFPFRSSKKRPLRRPPTRASSFFSKLTHYPIMTMLDTNMNGARMAAPCQTCLPKLRQPTKRAPFSKWQSVDDTYGAGCQVAPRSSLIGDGFLSLFFG